MRLSLLLAALLPPPAAPATTLPADSPLVSWQGRTARPLALQGGVQFDWSLTSARLALAPGASALSATLALPPGAALRLAVAVDGGAPQTLLLAGAVAPQAVPLAAGLDPAAPHAVTLTSAAEPLHIYYGSASSSASSAVAPAVLSFTTDGAFARPPPPPTRTLMLIGDSITAASGSEGVPPCRGNLTNSDASRGWGARLAANLTAALLGNIAWSGKGVYQNCCDEGPTMAALALARLGGAARADWDFNNPTRPQVLVLALGTNDFYQRDPANATFVAAFEAAYEDLVIDLAVNKLSNGTAAIFLGVGPITDVYGPAVQRVVARTAALGLPVRYLSFMGAALDGCSSHPGALGHAQMAATAAAAIRAATGWDGGGGGGSGGSSAGSATTAAAAAAAAAQLRLRAAALAARPRAPPPVSPPPPMGPNLTFTVRSAGGGDFTSIQAALAHCNASGNASALGHVTLRLLGTFAERVEVSALFAAGATLVGEGSAPTDALITAARRGADYSTWWAHTMLVGAPGVTLANLAIANSADGYDAALAAQSPALHLDVTADRFACLGCALYGGQDTLYTGGAGYGLRSYFGGGSINGTCDSVFGGSSSVFEGVALGVSGAAAAPRGEPASAYLFLNCSLDAPAGQAPALPALLGRPWGQLSTLVWRGAALGASVAPRGWDDWQHGCVGRGEGWCAPLYFAEAGSSGAGADAGARAPWSWQLNASQASEWTRERVLRGWSPPGAAA